MSTLQPSPGPPSRHHITRSNLRHDDVIRWKHFPRYWPFVRWIHRSLEFPAQRPVMRSFYVFFDLCPNKQLSTRWWGWWCETPPSPLLRHCNGSTTWDRAYIYMKMSLLQHGHVVTNGFVFPLFRQMLQNTEKSTLNLWIVVNRKKCKRFLIGKPIT